MPHGDFGEGFAGDVGNDAPWRRIAHGQKDEGALVCGASQDRGEKTHWAWCVREGDQTRKVNRRDEHAGGDAD